MSARNSFDAVLDAALSAAEAGVPVGEILRRYPRYADDLRPLLDTAAAVWTHATLAPAPQSERLTWREGVVLGAVQRERARRGGEPVAPWWRRRLAFASLSVPASIAVACAVVGVGGAAAATTAAVRGDNPVAAVRRTISAAARPLDNLDSVVPPTRTATPSPAATQDEEAAGGSDGGQEQGAGGGGGHGPSQSASRTAEHDDRGGGATSTTEPGNQGGKRTPDATHAAATVTLSGTIRNIHGDGFKLDTPDGDIDVRTDGDTIIDGDVVEGGHATVRGRMENDNKLLAERIEIIDGDPASTPQPSATPDQHGDGDGAPTETATPSPDATPDSGHGGSDGGNGGGHGSDGGSGSGGNGSGSGNGHN